MCLNQVFDGFSVDEVNIVSYKMNSLESFKIDLGETHAPRLHGAAGWQLPRSRVY